jgi:predicted nucleic acid-binding protein
MEQVASPRPPGRSERTEAKRTLVFLDTNVVLGCIRGDPSETKLLSAEAAGLVHLAVNPVVLQELLMADATGSPAFERIKDRLRVLPLDIEKVEALHAGARSRRYHTAHTNDLLILSSAEECNFLVTRDSVFWNFQVPASLQIVTPEEMVARAGVE